MIKKKKINIEKFDEINNLNIGCGKHHLSNYINLDISNYCKPDIQHDIRTGFKDLFQDSKFDEVLANGVLEMILPNEEFVLVFNELHRVLKLDGHLVGQVPSIDPRVLMLDPFDRRWFKEETFEYFDIDKNPYKTFGTQYGFKPWNVMKAETNENGIINFDMSPAK